MLLSLLVSPGNSRPRRVYAPVQKTPPEVQPIVKELKGLMSGVEFDGTQEIVKNGELIQSLVMTPEKNEDGFDVQIKLSLKDTPLSVNWGSFPEIVAKSTAGEETIATQNRFTSPLTNEVTFWFAALPKDNYKIEIREKK